MGIHMCLDMNTCQGLLKEWLKLNKWLAVTLTSIIISGSSDSYTFGLQRTSKVLWHGAMIYVLGFSP